MNMEGDTTKYFEEEDVTVTIPNRTDVEVIPLPFRTEDGAWELVRLVIDFKVEDSEGELVEDFDPPLVLEVGFTLEDLAAAGGDPQKLKLGYLDHDSGVWTLMETAINSATLKGTATSYTWQHRHTGWLRSVF